MGRIYLRRAEQTEGWLLHQLYDTGALRLLDNGGRQVASNLILFVRTGELRVLLSHLPLKKQDDLQKWTDNAEYFSSHQRIVTEAYAVLAKHLH